MLAHNHLDAGVLDDGWIEFLFLQIALKPNTGCPDCIVTVILGLQASLICCPQGSGVRGFGQERFAAMMGVPGLVPLEDKSRTPGSMAFGTPGIRLLVHTMTICGLLAAG